MTIQHSLHAKHLASLGAALVFGALAVGCGGGGGAAAAGTAPDGDGPAAGGNETGKPATELSVTPVTGDGPKSLADAKGKVVIIDFWATYCGPCRKSFPKYQELVDQFAGDLAVIAVSLDDPADIKDSQLIDFAKETKVSFAVVWDKEHKTAEAYKPAKMPTSFVIDKEGNIRHVHAGYESGEEDKIAAEVKALLGK